MTVIHGNVGFVDGVDDGVDDDVDDDDDDEDVVDGVDDVKLPDLISLITVLPSGALISNSGHVSWMSMKSFNNALQWRPFWLNRPAYIAMLTL